MCGDGVKNRAEEECDQNDFGSTVVACPSGTAGVPVCTDLCVIDDSPCKANATCGNGKTEGAEQCDNQSPRCVDCAISCQANEEQFGEHCYAVTEAQSWSSAGSACKSIGGSLVTIGSSEENTFVWDLVDGDPSAAPSSKVWIGLNDRSSEGKYVWVSGDNAPYRNWRSGEPNAQTLAEDCGAMYLQNAHWNDDECLKPFRAVCEIDPTKP